MFTGAAIAMVVALLLNREPGDAVDGPPEPAGSEEVRATIEQAVETRDAEDCDRLATPAYLRQYERRGRSALAACQKGVFERDRGLLPSDVGVEVIEVSTKKALALVTYRSGGQAGITARLPLVRDANDRLVLAPIPSFERATRRQMNRALRAEVATGPVTFGGRAAACTVQAARKLSDLKLEAFLLRGSASELFTLVAGCDPGAFGSAIVDEVREAGSRISPAEEPCYQASLESIRPAGLVQLLVDIEETGKLALTVQCARA